MKKKIIDLSNKEMNKICSKYIKDKCAHCPLQRYNEERHINYIYCYKELRALYYSTKLWYLQHWKDRPDLEETLEKIKEEQIEIEQAEVELEEV